MTLTEFAIAHCRRVGAGDGYIHQMTVLCRRFDWTPADLTAERVDQYLTDALHRLSPQTVANHRRMLSTLRREAIRIGLLVDDCTGGFRRVKCPRELPVAWDHGQILHLIATAENMSCGTSRCKWKVLLPAYIRVAYSSGLRLGDMLEIRHDAIRGSRLGILMAKTKRPHVCVLDDAALGAIATLPVWGPRIFGDLVGRCVFLRAFKRLVKRAKLSGTSKFLRRSSATYAVIDGQDPTGHLGHATAGLAMRHYVDPVLVAQMKRPVPSLNAQ